MILMPQIFDVTANENARYKQNELEILFHIRIYIINLLFLKSPNSYKRNAINKEDVPYKIIISSLRHSVENDIF